MAGKSPTRNRKTKKDIRAFLARYEPGVQGITLKLRGLVLEVAPNALEQIDLPARLLGYGFAQTYKDTLCVIMPLKAGVNLGFPNGVDLPDPRSLLIGAGKRARHVNLTDAHQVRSPALRALLSAAVRQLRSNRGIKR